MLASGFSTIYHSVPQAREMKGRMKKALRRYWNIQTDFILLVSFWCSRMIHNKAYGTLYCGHYSCLAYFVYCLCLWLKMTDNDAGSFCTTTPRPTTWQSSSCCWPNEKWLLDHPLLSPGLAPADYFLFPKVKSHLKERLFDSISDIQKAVTSTLNTIAKDDFYKGIQKLYDRANLLYS